MTKHLIFKGLGGNPGTLLYFLTGGLDSAEVVETVVYPTWILDVAATGRVIDVSETNRVIDTPRSRRVIEDSHA